MVIALVPIDFDVIWRDRHRYWKNLDRFKTGEYLGKPIWHDCEQVGICDNHRKHVKSWHAYRIFAANLVTRQYLIDDGMSHSGRVSNGVLRFHECFKAHSGSKSGMTRTHDANKVLRIQKGLQKSRCQIVKKSKGEVDFAGAEACPRIVRNGQDAHARAGRLLGQKRGQARQGYHLPYIVGVNIEAPCRRCRVEWAI